jgi:F420-dependent oxidoreductase-like protein
MKTAIGIGGYASDNIKTIVDYVQTADRLGVDYVWSAEAWGQDAVTTLAYLAGQTENIKLGTGIMQISARVPSMTAMTAISMHQISNGRFVLGLGVSGPQVVEGLQGRPYAQPLTRLKETVDIVRMAFRGEKLQYNGRHHVLPLPGGEGKAIKLDHPPTEIPIFLATLGPKALEYTGAAADGWLGTSFSPEHAEAHLDYIRKGAAGAGRSMDQIELNAACTVAIGENVEEMINSRRRNVAFQMGAMGSGKTNFYNDAFKRAGYTEDAVAIQRLWIEGKRQEAADRVPDAMVTEFGAIGTPEMVKDRFHKYKQAGITSLSLRLDSTDRKVQIDWLEQCLDLLRDI